MVRRTGWLLFFLLPAALLGQAPAASTAPQGSVRRAVVDAGHVWSEWQGWGSSLAWWARAVGGTANAPAYADLLYTTGDVTVGDQKVPGLGFNIVRYNAGGGGIDQLREKKSPKLRWYMDMHGFWTSPPDAAHPRGAWDWNADANQREMLRLARERGANVFELWSDSPMWWMTNDDSAQGSVSGGDCLAPAHYDDFATYMAMVAKHARDEWGVTFASVEPFNEPSADWWKYPVRQEGCHFDRSTQRAILAKLRVALDAAGLKEMPIAASDENDADVALRTWNDFDASTRALVERVNVHGYRAGTHVYRGPNMAVLREDVSPKPLWMSEYGDGDPSGATLAGTIIFDIRELHPRAWIYWQPVEPQRSGWGMLNADYVDTGDKPNPSVMTPIVQINRKYFVYGQFTRYIRAGSRIVAIDDANSIAAYDEKAHRLVVVTQTGRAADSLELDLSRFARPGESYTTIATSTASASEDSDRKLSAGAPVKIKAGTKSISLALSPNTVETIVIEGVYR